MNKKNKELLKEHLNKEIKKCQKLIEDLRSSIQPVKLTKAIGRVTRMDAIQENSVRENTLQKEIQKLESMKSAVNQISNPDFGICLKCKSDIIIERLKLFPLSKVCTICMNKKNKT